MSVTKQVPLICECGESWTYSRPVGKRGRNPSTNPEHKQCGVKRQNKNRALSRERQRTGETYFHWHLTAPDKAQNLTVEEESVRRDVIVNPWWITEAHTSEGSQETCVPDEWRPKSIPLDVRYSTPEDDQKARRWLSETRSGGMSGCDVGRTAERDLTVIGSAEPWNTLYTYRDVPHCAMDSLTSMEPFVFLL